MQLSKMWLSTGLSLGLATTVFAQTPPGNDPAEAVPPAGNETQIETPIGNVKVRTTTTPPNSAQVNPNRVDPLPGAVYTPGVQGQAVTAPRAASPQAVPAQAAHLESHLVNCLILKNQEEVELSRFSQNELQNEKVKKFAAQLVASHQQSLNQLRALKIQQSAQQETSRPATFTATEVVTTTAPATTAPSTPAPSTSAQRRAERQVERAERQLERATGVNVELTPEVPLSGRQVVGYRGRVMLQPQYVGKSTENDVVLQIQQDATQESLDLAVNELIEAKEHQQVDQAFLGIQAGMHMHMLAQLQALEKHTTGELQQYVTEAKATTEKHLQMAKSLMQEIDQK
ncbi:hypothetical protein [Planctopirus hydrillae]|nr:hypothetical protein [Planctopirus hydrillae]